MPKYSRGQERDECAKMWRGFWHSTFGIVFCWVPLVGLVLSISGFARQVVRMTDKYKKRWILFLAYGLLSLVISIGAITYGLYAYVQDSEVFTKIGTSVWTAITGQPSLPGQLPPTDYSGMADPGLGAFGLDGAGIDGEGDATGLDETPEPDEPGEGNVLDDLEADASALVGRSLGGDADEDGSFFEAGDDEGDEFYDDEDYEYDEDYEDDEELPELDFSYEVLDQEEFEVGDEICTSYKLCTDKADMTDQDLLDLFKDVCYGDGYYLHNVYVYKSDESDIDKPYDYAAVEQQVEDADPVITRAK